MDNLQKESSVGAPFSKPKPSTLTSAPGKTSLLPSLQLASLKTVPIPSEGCRARFQATIGPTGLPNFSETALGGIKNQHVQTHSTPFRQKLWKTNHKAKRLVVGNDVGLEDTCRMSLCSLVGLLS